ncbi:phosphonopyruvate decarboxylase [Burkholderia ubonensis]|uniref:phosphonopyruvate decarboxylase n=1 Tax=Burkholderia ubonensis TaxID=101571 RepID=UPI002ABDA6BA|nr:phosphonopyruvate decarboxylase [Burkholderia ubonensis]
MIDVRHFVDVLVAAGADVFTGIPCSYLTPLINEAIARPDTQYVVASSEGDAVSIAFGCWLAGKTAVVLSQNSGLGNMVNPLTSLGEPARLPVLLLVTWRGRPGTKDEPQHRQMGEITPGLFDLLGIRWSHLPDDETEALRIARAALDYIGDEERPYALLMPGDSFTADARPPAPSPRRTDDHGALPTRADILKAFVEHVEDDAVVIATTGKTGRELFTLADRPGNFYCVGSMGYANSVAHGVALASSRKVYVLDGDGAAIMHLGNLTSIGAGGCTNLTHIVLDNSAYDSTGAQPTASSTTDFALVARAAGYAHADTCVGCDDFVDSLRTASPHGPRLLRVPISIGSMPRLGRPAMGPDGVARRLRSHLADSTLRNPDD